MFDLADIWATRTGQEVRLVSANDHIHSRRSAHNAGLALDFQSSDPDGLSTIFRLAGYRVLWKVPGHYGHVHVEQDGSSGTSQYQGPSSQMVRGASTTRPRPGLRVGG